MHYSNRDVKLLLLISGVFLSLLTLMNILGVSHFIRFQVGPLAVSFPVGILPYPLTFLCTDVISELYGRKMAQQLVWVGLLSNTIVLFILWGSGLLPGDTSVTEGGSSAFFAIRSMALSGIAGSMVAYLVAQSVDVYVFHRLKSFTNNKHLWLRNNVSTLISQLLDTIIVTTFIIYLSNQFFTLTIAEKNQLIIQISIASYGIKALMALLDTPLCYLSVLLGRRYLKNR